METIGFFQLENLIVSRSTFAFVDLRSEDTQPLPEPLNQYLKHAQKVAPKDVSSHVQKISADKARPILLLSQDENESTRVAHGLEAAGYSNVYIVAGGVLGLLSEL